METQHNTKLEQKRAERKKKDSEDSPSEKREVVMHGAKLKCEYAEQLGDLKVTSNEISLQDQLWATEGDGNNMVNLQFKGKCGHPKWPAQNMSPPPCMSVIKLSPWQNLGTSFVQEQKVLIKSSCITCNPDFNSAKASPIPKAESIKREPVQTPKVKTVKLISALHKGSKNDKSKTEQPGLVFGKTYEFKVTEYVNGKKPENLVVVKWMFRYHSLSKNSWVEKKLNVTGDTLKLKMSEKDMCGRFIYVRAYIEDTESEGELKVWKHNRFRYFDKKVFEEELNERTDGKKPWLINQSGTSLCGMACIFYLFAKEKPADYKKFAKELFRTGEGSFNKYEVKPSIEILDKKPNTTGFPVSLGRYMPIVDYITLASTRNADNNSYKGGDEEFQAINWPPLMTGLSEKLLGYKDVVSHGIYNPIKKGTNYPPKMIFKIVEDINKQLMSGYKIIMMIDSDLISDDPDFYVPKKFSFEEIKKAAKSPFELDYHWVVLETLITEHPWLNSKGQTEYKLDFKVYSWGGNTRYLKEQITLKHFINNFYGYIKVK